MTLEVELTRPWPEVKWTRNAAVLAPSENVEIHAEGTRHRLVLRSVSFADRGFFGCETPDDKTQAKVNVESKPGSGPQRKSGVLPEVGVWLCVGCDCVRPRVRWPFGGGRLSTLVPASGSKEGRDGGGSRWSGLGVSWG